jgi:high-affinity iron transporter
MLTARDATLMGHIESAMGEFRASLQQGRPADEVATRVQVLDGLFDDADAALSPDAASSASTFLGAFTILLREGLEALLIVVAMIAFLAQGRAAGSAALRPWRLDRRAGSRRRR